MIKQAIRGKIMTKDEAIEIAAREAKNSPPGTELGQFFRWVRNWLREGRKPFGKDDFSEAVRVMQSYCEDWTRSHMSCTDCSMHGWCLMNLPYGMPREWDVPGKDEA